MTLTHPLAAEGPIARTAPTLAFAAALGAAVTVAAAAPPGLALAGLAGALFVAAAGVAFAAYACRERRHVKRVTCWDVAGALTFIGICAAALVEPEQLAGLVEAAPARRH